MSSINKINKICSGVLSLTDSDFDAVYDMAEKQLNYIHPLKNGKAHDLNNKGEHNMRVLEALKNLRDTIESGSNM